MADVASRGLEGARKLGWADTLLLKEDRGEHQRLGEGQPFVLQQGVQGCFHAACNAAGLEDGALFEKGFDSHGFR